MTLCRHLTRPVAQLAVVTGALIGIDGTPSKAWQGDQTSTISVNDPRPLAQVIEELEKRYGWVITYEDPAFFYPSDIEDVTLSVRRDGRTEPRVLVPRGGPFNFQYPVSAGNSAQDQSATLAKLVQDYNRSGHPGVFRVIQTGTVFHVVPLETRNANGQFVPRRSLLDVNISIADRERTALEMLREITNAVSQLGGAKVGVGTVPLNAMILTRVQDGTAGESARTVLLRTLEAVHPKLSWRLLCTPGPMPECPRKV
jgi:hypothetical protein